MKLSAHLLGDCAFANYVDEAKRVDAEVPQLFVIAEHWSETARKFLVKHCPKSQVEVFGGHMMFWEYPDRFNALLRDFAARA